MQSLNNSRVYRTFACVYQKMITGVLVAHAAARWLHSAAANFYGPFVMLSPYTTTLLSSTPWFSLLRKFFLCVVNFLRFSFSFDFFTIFYSPFARNVVLVGAHVLHEKHIFHGKETLTCENLIFFMAFLITFFLIFFHDALIDSAFNYQKHCDNDQNTFRRKRKIKKQILSRFMLLS